MADGALESGLANANVELLDLLRPQNNHVFHVERMEKGLSYGVCGGLVQNQPMILGSYPVSSCDEPKTDGLIFGSGQPNLTFQEDSWFNYDASSIGRYEQHNIRTTKDFTDKLQLKQKQFTLYNFGAFFEILILHFFSGF